MTVMIVAPFPATTDRVRLVQALLCTGLCSHPEHNQLSYVQDLGRFWRANCKHAFTKTAAGLYYV